MSDKLFDYGVQCIRGRVEDGKKDEATVAIRHVIAVARRRLAKLEIPESYKPTISPKEVAERQEQAKRRKEIIVIHKFRSAVMYGRKNVDDVWFDELPALANEHSFLGLLAIKLLEHAQPNEKVRVRDAVSDAALAGYIETARRQVAKIGLGVSVG